MRSARSARLYGKRPISISVKKGAVCAFCTIETANATAFCEEFCKTAIWKPPPVFSMATKTNFLRFAGVRFAWLRQKRVPRRFLKRFLDGARCCGRTGWRKSAG